MKGLQWFLLFGMNLKLATSLIAQKTDISLSLVSTSFVYEEAPFKECHASSLVEVAEGNLLATWFGGTREKNPDVTIWLAEYSLGKWGEIREVATGIQNDSLRYPCWNPVLFKHSSGALYLFYKVGPSPSSWWGESIRSEDLGKTWTKPHKLPEGFFGPIRAKPLELADGRIFCPSSLEIPNGKWSVHIEVFNPRDQSWKRIAVDDQSPFDIIQPTVLTFEEGRTLQILCRSRQNKIIESWSYDGGNTWSKTAETMLPNPSAGIDAVSIPEIGHFLIFNPTVKGPGDRAKLAVAFSRDGKNWEPKILLEDHISGEFSYPAMIPGKDGRLKITYTWKRKKIRFAELAIK
jgi:alpha-L-fucosidase